MKKVLPFICLAAFLLILNSCKKTDLISPTITAQSPSAPAQTPEKVAQGNLDDKVIIGGRTYGEPCEPTTVTLIAGQFIDAGTVTVSNDNDYIYVTYTTTNGWVLTQTHLYVGDCALIPVNNPGNPIPGQFPYVGTHNNLTTYTYQVPISRIPLEQCGCIAAHAVVKKYNSSNQVIDSQTAWGNGVRINLSGGNWGMKFDYCSCTP